MKKSVRFWRGNMKKMIILLLLIIVFLGGFLGYSYLLKKQKQYRILACISSYNRPMFASAQVLRLLRQSYPVDISISIKGVPQEFVREALLKEWKNEVASGRVRVRVDENRDQYANLLDTVRDIDLDQYDYFCKIDDDDWYGPDYFKHVNEWLNKEDGIAISHTTKNMIVSPGKDGVDVWKNNTPFSGPSMCFSRQMILKALELENNPEEGDTLVPDSKLSQRRYRTEDHFLHRLGRVLGKEQVRDTPVWDLIFGWQYRSIMRPNN